jgi:hypothetical protein
MVCSSFLSRPWQRKITDFHFSGTFLSHDVILLVLLPSFPVDKDCTNQQTKNRKGW